MDFCMTNFLILKSICMQRLRLPGETHLGFREMSKPHLVTFQLMTKCFDIGETSKLCKTSKLQRFVLTNQNVLISIVPFVPGVSPVLNLRSHHSLVSRS